MASVSGCARRGGRRGAAWVVLCLLALLLGACGAPAEKTALVAAVEPSSTPIPSPTATPRPTATATPPPTATRPPSPSAPPPTLGAPTAAAPTAAAANGDYTADFSQWYVGETAGKYRTDYDKAADAYHLTIIENDYNVSVYAPEGRTFTNFVLEVDARRASGPDAGGYGLVFRRQPRGNDQASVRYVFYVQPEGHFGVYLVRPDGSEQTLQAPTPSAAIKVGNATNHLAVACQGDTITVSINGQAVGTYTATVLNAGEIGLYASSPTNTGNLEAVFTNLRLTSK